MNKTERALAVYHAAVAADDAAIAAVLKEAAKPRTAFSRDEAQLEQWRTADDRKIAEWEAGHLLTIEEAANGDELARAADLTILLSDVDAALATVGTATEIQDALVAVRARIATADAARVRLSKRRIAAGLPQPRPLPPATNKPDLAEYRSLIVARIAETKSRSNETRIWYLRSEVNARRAADERRRLDEERERTEQARARDARAREVRDAAERERAAQREKQAAFERRKREDDQLAAASRAREP